MKDNQTIVNLTYEDFQALSLQKVREDNHLKLVETWEENVLSTEYYINKEKDYYSATIYFLEESYTTGYYIKRYSFTHLVRCSTFFNNGFVEIESDVISKISKLEELLAKSKDRHLYSVLKDLKVELS